MSRVSMFAVGAALISFAIILIQRAENSRLQKESAELRQTAENRNAGGRAGVDARGRTDRAREESGSAGPGSIALRPGVLKDLLSENDPIRRARGLVAFAESLRVEDIAEALEELRAGGGELGPDERMLAHLLLTRWASEDPDGALASVKTARTKKNWGDVISVVGGLAAYDPERAASWLADPESVLAQHPWMSHRLAATVARQWMQQDPDAALAWAQSLPKSQRAGAYGGLIRTLASSDPKRASEVAASLEEGDARRHALGEVASVWASTAPEEAVAWAQTLEGEDRVRVTRESLEAWVQSDPAGAANYVDTTEEGERGRYVTTVAGNWAQQDPPEAAAWVARQPEGEGKNDAMGHVMWNWTNRDPEAAGTWIGGQPDGAARDQGVAGLAKAAFNFDPRSALDWAITIGNDEMREQSVRHGLREWSEESPAAAQEWAKSNEVEIPRRNEGGENRK